METSQTEEWASRLVLTSRTACEHNLFSAQYILSDQRIETGPLQAITDRP